MREPSTLACQNSRTRFTVSDGELTRGPATQTLNVLPDPRPADLLTCSIWRDGGITDVLMVDPTGLQHFQTNATGTNITFDATLTAMNTAFSRGLSFRATANNDANNITVLVVDNGSFGETNVVSQSRSLPMHVVAQPGFPP